MNLEDTLILFVNGAKHTVNIHDVTLEKTLNTFLRSKLNLTGTKRMCLEGGCGACIVVVERKNHATKKATLQAVNSCLVPLFLCNGWKITTIEGITTDEDYHYLQKALSHFNGSQCGFCSPGMVMNMYSISQNKKITMKEVENSFGGNICRCTGYRSILSAFKSVCDDASPDLLMQYPDIEDLKRCQKSCLKPCGINKKCLNPIYFNLGQTTWIRVFLLNDLLQILKTFHNSSYMLVAGNTSVGVYKPTRKSQVYVDITSIEELTTYKIENNSLILGANLTLTETMEILEKVANDDDKFTYLKKLRNHIDLIANVPVRNLGTLAGNLMIKHHHNEFPSDIFLILETVGAFLVLVDSESNRSKIPVKDLLQSPMAGKVIEKIILPSLSSNFKYESYKIMPRAQNAHALVNAGFLLELKNNIVQSARIVFGSITPSFTHALKTENFLIGKEIFSNDNLQKAFETLDEELVPNQAPAEPCPSFRKHLAISLFYKYILSIAPKALLSPRHKSGANLLERSLTTSVHEFETKESLYPVSRPLTKTESLAQTSGQAQYIIDMPDLPGQLFGAFVLAKIKPLSVIRKIDASEALKLKGVVAFFTKDDIPGQNNFMPKEANSFFLSVKEEIFCSGEVQYFNQPLGLVVAISQEIAEEAAKLVTVSYNGSANKPLMTIHDVIKFGKGKNMKLEAEIKPQQKHDESEHTINGTFEMSWQYHYHMETQCCNIVPTEDGLNMYPSSQWLDLSQTAAALALNIPLNKINVVIRRLGGAFGGKISRNSLISCAAALAAYKLKKPVKIWLPFETNMDMIGKRYPTLSKYEIGVDNTGTIQYLNNTFYFDYGVGGNECCYPFNMDMSMESYNSDNWHIKAYSTKTNNPASCYIRAPGTCEGLAMIEAIMEHAAIKLDMDPTEFRLKNINTEKHAFLVGFIKELHKWADIDNRRNEIRKFNEGNRWKKRGLAVVPMVYAFEMFGHYGVIVSIYKSDGSVSIAHGGVEMGQGINTKVAQVCAYKFGIPIEKIAIKPSNTLIAPNAHMVGASLTSETVCHGVMQACDILLERMNPIKEQLDDPTWDNIVKKCYNDYINLSAASMGNPKDLKNYLVYGVCASEIELDVLTGQYIIRRVDLLEDAGTSMNPSIDLGQVEGAFLMGMGYFTSEQIIIAENGELLTNRTWNYKPPGAKDIPIDFRIKFPTNTPNHVGVLNSKAIGEPPLCLSCSVPLAIRHAVASARGEADGSCEKWYPFCGPSTVENVFVNCLNDFKQYTL